MNALRALLDQLEEKIEQEARGQDGVRVKFAVVVLRPNGHETILEAGDGRIRSTLQGYRAADRKRVLPRQVAAVFR